MPSAAQVGPCAIARRAGRAGGGCICIGDLWLRGLDRVGCAIGDLNAFCNLAGVAIADALFADATFTDRIPIRGATAPFTVFVTDIPGLHDCCGDVKADGSLARGGRAESVTCSVRVGVMGTVESSVAVDAEVMLSSEDVCGNESVLYILGGLKGWEKRFLPGEPAALAFRGELTDASRNAIPDPDPG